MLYSVMNFVGYQYQIERNPHIDEENVGDDDDDELTD